MQKVRYVSTMGSQTPKSRFDCVRPAFFILGKLENQEEIPDLVALSHEKTSLAGGIPDNGP